VDVESSPMATLDDSWLLARRPGYPIALRIESTGNSGLNKLVSQVYANFGTDKDPVGLSDTFGKLRPLCPTASACNPPPSDKVTTLPTGTYANNDLPEFPFSANTTNAKVSLPKGVTRAVITQSKPNYPFTSTPPSLTSLETGCKKSEDIDANRPGEIDCWIDTIQTDLTVPNPLPITLDVNTNLRPVNLIILGDVGSGINPDKSYVSINHKHTVDGVFGAFDHTNVSSRLNWNRLRIFGRNPNPVGQCTTSATAPRQQFYIRANFVGSNSTSLAGAFLWLPDGDLTYGLPTEAAPSPSGILSSWWVCNLDINFSGKMNFILPLYGNPDALAAILPGGYVKNGMFTVDSRFPVYPTMLRIRSVY
jgi:hypothetical protein